MAISITWDTAFEAAPADGDNASGGAGKFRELKLAISEREDIEHDFKSTGKHRPGLCAILYVGTTVQIAALTGMPAGGLAWDTTLGVLKYYSGSAWVTVSWDHGLLTGLGDDDHTQYLHLDKEGQTLQHSILVTDLMTIDGRDISVDGATLDALAAGTATVYANYARFSEAQASGTEGGSFTLGSWVTRTLNTTDVNDVTSCVLASNQISLPAGTYRVRASAPSWGTLLHQIRLRDITNGATLIAGSSEYSSITGSQTRSVLEGKIVLAGTVVLEIQHQCSGTRLTSGLGKACSFGENEVYTIFEIWEE